MIDEMQALRSFRSDVAGPDPEALERISRAVTSRTGRSPSSTHRGTPAITTDLDAADAYVPLSERDGGRTDGEHRAPPSRRRVILALCAALVLVAGVVAIASTRGDDTPVVDEGTGLLPPLLADPPPEGMVLLGGLRAEDMPTLGTVRYGPEGGGDVEVTISAASAPAPESGPSGDDVGEPVVINGAAGTLTDLGRNPVVRWRTDDHAFHLRATGLTDDEALDIANATRVDETGAPLVDAGALPAGWVEIYRAGPETVDPSFGTIVYRAGPQPPGVVTEITVSWKPGEREDLRRSGEAPIDAVECGTECPLVRGAPTLAHDGGEDGASAHLLWVEDGRMTTLRGSGEVTLEDLYDLADRLRPSTWEEIDELSQPPDPAQPAEEG